MSERTTSLIPKSGRKLEAGVIIASEAIAVVDVVESTLTSNLFGWYAVGRGLMRELRRTVQVIGTNHNLLCMKSTGDGYLLAYGNDKSAELSAIHAIDASLELIRLLRRYNGKRTTAEERRIGVRIAVHFGQVDVVENAREGPHVAYAFRLEAINRESMHEAIDALSPDQLPLRDYILCSEPVADILKRRGHHSNSKRLGLFRLKGFQDWHEVFLLCEDGNDNT